MISRLRPRLRIWDWFSGLVLFRGTWSPGFRDLEPSKIWRRLWQAFKAARLLVPGKSLNGRARIASAAFRELFVVAVDSHFKRIVLATEETPVTQQVSHRSIKGQSRSWSQRVTKVNRSHHGDNPLYSNSQGSKSRQNPCQVQPTREHRKFVGVKAMSSGTNYSFYCHV